MFQIAAKLVPNSYCIAARQDHVLTSQVETEMLKNIRDIVPRSSGDQPITDIVEHVKIG